MQRITDPTASATLVPPPALTGPTGYFAPAVPGVSVSTRLRYWYMTMIQEEIMSVLAAASITADTTGTVFTQLLAAIRALIATAGGANHGVASFSGNGTFVVPAGVTSATVEVWGAGSGSWASTTSIAGGGGSGGGYTRKRCSGALAFSSGDSITVTIGAGGSAGTSGAAPGSGGTSSFGAFCSATGGTINTLNSVSAPSFGNIGGWGVNGDVNVWGSDGQAGAGSQGGMGGGGAMGGGMINSGATGRSGYFPAGGASGAGCPSGVSYPGAAGFGGFVLVTY